MTERELTRKWLRMCVVEFGCRQPGLSQRSCQGYTDKEPGLAVIVWHEPTMEREDWLKMRGETTFIICDREGHEEEYADGEEEE